MANSMAKMYTFDDKLLCGAPKLVIGDKAYPIDDRRNTVKKAYKLFQSAKSDSDLDGMDEVLKLAFGENFAEIEAMDMSFKAYQELFTTVLSIMTGEDPESSGSGKGEKQP